MSHSAASSVTVVGTFDGHLVTRGRTSGHFSNPAVFVESLDGEQKYAVVSLRSDVCVVDREDYDRVVQGKTWWKHVETGYAYGRASPDKICSLHSTLWTAAHEGRSAEDTIDHIDRIKMDNRRSNLRDVPVSVQNSNRGTRSDKLDAPPELAAFGVGRMPRYVVFDQHERKFHFLDHPMVKKLAAAQVVVKAVGTKSASCKIPERLHDCLTKYVKMHDAHRHHFGRGGDDDVLDSAPRRTALRDSFVAIVMAAHAHDPANFPVPTDDGHDGDDDDEETFARAILARLPAPPTGAIGTENRERRFVKLPDAPVVLCFATPQYPAFMFDERHMETLATVTWDMDTGRMTSNPELMRRFPRTFTARSKHVQVALFVAMELEGAVVDPASETVTTFTPIRQDLRAANLLVVPLTPRGYKPSGSLEPPEGYNVADGAAPIRFLPRGVSMTKNSDKLEFHVRMAPLGDGRIAPRKFSIKDSSHSTAVFENSVVPMLDGGWSQMFSTARLVSPNAVPDDRVLSDWRVGHAHFTELIEGYEAAQV